MDTPVAGAVKQLAQSGLKSVNYESGHIDQLDTAVRRAVMTGVNQVNQRYREQSLEYLGTDLVEVTAHSGARDKDGPMGWENHKKWQGKVYRWKKKAVPQSADSASEAAGLSEQREQKVPGSGKLPPGKNLKSLIKDRESGIIKADGIGGALNPESVRAETHAKRYYEAVRKMTTDVKRIAKNTGYAESDIQRIKNFIFLDKHNLGDGRISRFDASYEMAESWQRLIDGKTIQPHDLTLLKHEMMERELMLQGFTQDEAHIITSQKYNYAKEAYEYYHGKIRTD